jgi:hypothetical protein
MAVVQVGVRYLNDTPEHITLAECSHCFAMVRDVKLEEHIRKAHPAE